MFAVTKLAVFKFSFLFLQGQAGVRKDFQQPFFRPGGKAVADELKGNIAFSGITKGFF